MVKKITGVFTTLDAEGNEVELYPEGTLGSDNSVTLTRAEYDALSDKEKDSDTTYYISDEDAQPNAFSVPFTSNKYTASNTGDALNEVKTELEETNSNLNNIISYSSEEKEVGTFLDGKTIYKKKLLFGRYVHIINYHRFRFNNQCRGYCCQN